MVAELCHGGSLRDVVRDQMVSFSRVGVFCRHRSAQPFCGVTQRYSYSAKGSRKGIIVASTQLEVSVCPCWDVVAGMIPMTRVSVTCAGGLHVCGRAAVEHQHRRGAGVPAQAAAHDHSPRCEAGQRAAAGWAATPQGLACSCSVGLTHVTAEPRLQAMASLQAGGSPGSGRCQGHGCFASISIALQLQGMHTQARHKCCVVLMAVRPERCCQCSHLLCAQAPKSGGTPS
jgi:hypothetical protein